MCEHIGEQNEKYGQKEAPVVILRKVGVLRMDSCSELLLVRGEYKLKGINSVFVRASYRIV